MKNLRYHGNNWVTGCLSCALCSKLYLHPNQIILIKLIFPQRELHQTCSRSRSIHTKMQLCWLCQPWHTLKLKKSCDHTDLDGVVTVADVRGDTWRCHVCAANSLDFCNAAKLRLIQQLTWRQVGGCVTDNESTDKHAATIFKKHCTLAIWATYISTSSHHKTDISRCL